MIWTIEDRLFIVVYTILGMRIMRAQINGSSNQRIKNYPNFAGCNSIPAR